MISIFTKNGFKRFFACFGIMVLSVMLMPAAALAVTAGDMTQNAADNIINITNLVSAIAYIMGAAFTGVGVMKMRDWSGSPQQTKISEPFKFLAAGGLLIAAPAVAATLNQTFGIDSGVDGMTYSSGFASGPGYAGKTNVFNTVGGANGLDAMVVAMMRNITGPMTNLLLGFSYVAGAILAVVGLNRLTKSAQEGPRGPSGLGTMSTFVASAFLLSSSQVMNIFTDTLFGSAATDMAVYTEIFGMSDAAPTDNAENVISAILLFMIIVGTISFLRGIFVLRGFAEGNSQMTLMGGLSHIIAGILAVNLGQFIDVIQATLGITPASTGGIQIMFG